MYVVPIKYMLKLEHEQDKDPKTSPRYHHLGVVLRVAHSLVPVVGALDPIELASARCLSLPLISSSLPKLPVPHLHQVSRLVNSTLEPLYCILDRLIIVLYFELYSIQLCTYT